MSTGVLTAGAAAGLPRPSSVAAERHSRQLAAFGSCCCESGLKVQVRVGAGSVEAAVQAAALLDQKTASILAGLGGCMAAPASAGGPFPVSLTP